MIDLFVKKLHGMKLQIILEKNVLVLREQGNNADRGISFLYSALLGGTTNWILQ